jgi:uncharacterized membrane protein (UPF0136 family)
VGDRFCCGNCANQVHDLVQLNQVESTHISGGLLLGLLAAIGAAIAWATIGRLTGSEWGILAWGIGIFVGKSVLKGAQQRRGVPVQLIAMLMSVVGIMLGKLGFLYFGFRAAAQERGEPGTVGEFFGLLAMVWRTEPRAFFEPLDFLWYGIALWIAWRMCKPVNIPLTGPFPNQAVAPENSLQFNAAERDSSP